MLITFNHDFTVKRTWTCRIYLEIFRDKSSPPTELYRSDKVKQTASSKVATFNCWNEHRIHYPAVQICSSGQFEKKYSWRWDSAISRAEFYNDFYIVLFITQSSVNKQSHLPEKKNCLKSITVNNMYTMMHLFYPHNCYAIKCLHRSLSRARFTWLLRKTACQTPQHSNPNVPNITQNSEPR